MKKTAAKMIPLMVFLSLFSLIPAWAGESTDKCLSPYFFVESEDASTDRFPLRSTDVNAEISGVIADVTVRQRYTNDGNAVISAKYIFPASTRASVHGMKMIIGERVITAKVKKKEEARQTYDQAKKEGKSASLLEQQRPNVFSMEVAGILPGDTVDIELRYTELLIPTDATYEFVYPTVVGPRYSNMPETGAPQSEQWVKNPYLKKGGDARTEFNISVTLSTGLPLQEAVCISHDTDISWQNEALADIRLARPEDFSGDRDYILRYRLAGKQIVSGLMLYEGESENFFLLMVQPPERVQPADIPGREYIFVVDVSGSMNGFPLNTSKELLRDLIGGLRHTDTFNVLLFAGSSSLMSERSLPATQENIDKAIRELDMQEGRGGTELASAMDRAMKLPMSRAYSRSIIIVTDGYIQVEKEVFGSISENLNQCNVFAFGIGSSVNRFLIEGIAKAGMGEPFVVTGPDEAPAVAEKFREYISSPVLTHIRADFKDFETYDTEPPAIPDLFAKRPIIVFGKWRGERKGSIEIKGISGSGEYRQLFQVSETEAPESNAALRYLWARTRISRLSDFKPQLENAENRSEILSLGLTCNLLTAYTSFVAVDEIIRNPGGESRDVKQPLPLPKGVSNLAVSGGISHVPEPEIPVLLIFVTGMMILAYCRKRRVWFFPFQNPKP